MNGLRIRMIDLRDLMRMSLFSVIFATGRHIRRAPDSSRLLQIARGPTQ